MNPSNKHITIKKKGLSAFSVILIFACLLIIGVLLVPLLPVKLNPSQQAKVITVSFSMGGQSAQVVETEVTSKLEGLLCRIKGIKSVTSQSSNGSGSISVHLSEHADPDIIRFEISTLIRQAWQSLPQGVSYPSIFMPGSNDGTSSPFLRYTVNAPFSPVFIQEYINDNLKSVLAEVKGIDNVNVSGAGQMIYRLEYDYKQLQSLNISVRDIQAAIGSYLTQEFLGIGKITDENQREQWIRIALKAENSNQPFDAALVQVKNNAGTVIYLNQLVKTFYEEEELSSMFRINGLNTIYLSVTAEPSANQMQLSKQVRQLLADYKNKLPPGYELHLSYDASEYIQQEMKKIYFRSGLTVFLLLCFIVLVYRNLRYSLVILLSLIANVGIAVIFYYMFRLEMQLYSLAGLTISLTLIIDNAIIMSDQIINRGNKKTFVAILTATLTSIGALMAILWMDESLRTNLTDFVWVIIINLAVSLFIALFLVPALIERLKVKKRYKARGTRYGVASQQANLAPRTSHLAPQSKFAKFFKRIRGKRRLIFFNRIYEKIIVFMRKKRKLFIMFIVVAFGLPVFLLPSKIERKMERSFHSVTMGEELGYWAKLYNKTLGSAFYKENIKTYSDMALGGTFRLFVQKVASGSYAAGERSETMLNVSATLPNGSTRKQMDALIRKMEDYIGQHPEVRQYETTISSGQRAGIRIFFVKEHQRSGFPHLLKSKVVSKALELGGGSWGVYGVGDGFSNDVRERAGSNRIKLLGYNYDELQVLANTMQDSLMQNRRIKEVTIDSRFNWEKNDYTEFVFDVQREQLAQTDLLLSDLFLSVSPLLEKNISAGNWVNNGRTEAIRLFTKQAEEMDRWDLEHELGKVGEKNFRLSEIAGIERWIAPRSIAKENQQYLLCLQYDYIGSYAQEARVTAQAIEAFNRTAPLGYIAERDNQSFYWGGGKKASKQYALLFLIIIIIYFMTSFLFNSLKQPLVVIFVIPISYIGLFLAFYLFKLNFDQGGFAAFVLLSALTVNANIYILEEYNSIRRRKNIAPIRAYIKAWNIKIRPIFLTVISTILGFIPFLIGTYKEAFWFPLAVGTIGGLIVSLIATFCFLPLFMGVGKNRINNFRVFAENFRV
ncbi:MAG: efflux RND transporter permease subunit [Bacteroidales bacterium]|jgi:multidrug efflux pump subunit AcrB|nr:efflux RND transporter permease subunit [Bacteroidales bacterium]